MPISKITMFDALKRFTPIADGDQRYVDEDHSTELDLPVGRTVEAIGEGIAGILHEEIPVNVRRQPLVVLKKRPLQSPGDRSKMLKTTFLTLPKEKRQPIKPLGTLGQPWTDAIIGEMHERMTVKRAKEIVNAIINAQIDAPEVKLPQNPFRASDTEQTAFFAAVAADQKLADIFASATPPRFTSVTKDIDDYRNPTTGQFDPETFSSTEDADYCEAIMKAVRVLMTGKKEPMQLELDLPPGTPPEAAVTPTSETPDKAPAASLETSPKTSPKTLALVIIDPRSVPRGAKAVPSTPAPTPLSAAPPPPAPADQRSPLGTNDWWDDKKWPDSK